MLLNIEILSTSHIKCGNKNQPVKHWTKVLKNHCIKIVDTTLKTCLGGRFNI